MYHKLVPEQTVATIVTLKQRIEERFPGAGLGKVCDELCEVAKDSKSRAEKIARPDYLLRSLVGAITILGLLALVYSISLMEISFNNIEAGEFVQIVESGLNDLVFISAAIFFLITFETRIKRSRALDALHELRSIAHVIDMHQLTKDPSRVQANVLLTRSSPEVTMTAYELTRYLDYCSEMLSLTGKVAALYGLNFRDGVVLAAVTEIENLTTGLSRKIWQKIVILQKLSEQ